MLYIVQTATFKMAYCLETLPIRVEKSGTLMLNYVPLQIIDGLNAIASTSKFTSWVVMNSDFYDEMLELGDHLDRREQPDFIRASFPRLITLSMDGSNLSRDLLMDCEFPAVTTFELIPDSESEVLGMRNIVLSALIRIPSLRKLILPIALYCKLVPQLRRNYKNIQDFEIAVDYKWNWLAKGTGEIKDEDKKLREEEENSDVSSDDDESSSENEEEDIELSSAEERDEA